MTFYGYLKAKKGIYIYFFNVLECIEYSDAFCQVVVFLEIAYIRYRSHITFAR